MFHLGSFKLFTSESISKELNSSEYAKTEKRLKELSNYLGLNNGKQQSWPVPLQLANRVSSSISTNNKDNHANSGSVEKIVSLHWNDVYKSLVIVLTNGLITSIFFHPNYLNCIISIYLDKYLIGKIRTEHMVDFIFDSRRIVISYTNSRITCIFLDDVKKSKSRSLKKRKLFKLKSRNVKVVEYELDVNCGRRVERHLLKSEITSDEEDLIIVWWQNGSNTVCPWSSPITSNKDFCNILIYNLIRDSFVLVGFSSILNDIYKICFCKRRPNRLITIESEGDSRSYLYREYQINSNGEFYVIDLIESIQLSLPCQCIKADVNFELDKVLLLCEDRSVLMYSIDQNVLRCFEAPINAIDLINSPMDSYFIMSDACGQIMMYDYGLHVMSANYDDLFLREAFSGLSEMKFLDNSLLCLRFTDDPNLMLISLPSNLDYIGLIRTYVKHDYISEAIENLQQLNWNINSYLAYTSLNIIFNHLLRQPLNSIKESQLQETLASFFLPKIPVSEDIIEEYQYEMHCIAKRFFFHLYRYSCLEKSFLLALDLKSRHLFLLLHKIAKERGNDKLSQVSLKNAHKFNNSDSNKIAIQNSQQNLPDTYPSLPDQQHTFPQQQQINSPESVTNYALPTTLNNNNDQNNLYSKMRNGVLTVEASAIDNKESQEWQTPRQPMTTFKPCRKDSTNDSVPIYSSPRKRSEIITNKVTSGIFHAKIGQVADISNIPDIEPPAMVMSQVHRPKIIYSTNQSESLITTPSNSSTNYQQKHTSPGHPPRKTKFPMRAPPPVPPKIIQKVKLSEQTQPLINNETFPLIEETTQYAIDTRDNIKANELCSPQEAGGSETSILEENQLKSRRQDTSLNEKNDEPEISNIPFQLNYLLQDNLNSDKPKIECVHFGLV